MKSITIGDVRIKNQLFLAPMVDVTDMAYRMLCRKAGAGMAYTEMLYIDAILHENAATQSKMAIVPREKPVGLQVTGNNAEEFTRFSKLSALSRYNLIDINCGCPSMRITGNQAGSYLLNHPDKIGAMIRILKSAGFTTTAKIRLGFKENNALMVAKTVERAGADALTVHARLANQGGSVPADWKWIEKIKKHVGIPVIGNGDVTSGEKAASMLDIADGVMVARAAIGNPLIFKQITHYLKTKKEKEATPKQRLAQFSTYLTLAKKYDCVDLGRVKYVSGNFLKGFSGAASAREGIMKCKTSSEIQRFVAALEIY